MLMCPRLPREIPTAERFAGGAGGLAGELLTNLAASAGLARQARGDAALSALLRVWEMLGKNGLWERGEEAREEAETICLSGRGWRREEGAMKQLPGYKHAV